MDFLDFAYLSFLANSSTGKICQDLKNSIIGEGIWYDTFQTKNSEWLWFVNNIVAAMNSDKVVCGSFGLYPSYAAGILNSKEKIHLYVVFSEQLN